MALQAIETYRALQQAVKDAPHGKGLAFTEAVVLDKGFDHLRKMYGSALRDHPESQKKGPVVLNVVWERSVVPLCDAQASSEHHRSCADSAAVLRLSKLPCQAGTVGEQARHRLSPQASWCVDVYHVSEDLHECARAIHGEGESARSWAETELEELIRIGGPTYIERLNPMIATPPQADPLDALKSLRVYLEGSRDRMWYKQRLAEGKPISRGAIEGACKKIGSRLQLNSARWRPRGAERFGALLCLEYADQSRSY